MRSHALVFGATLATISCLSVAGGQIAGTSFEEPPDPGGQYTDTGDPAVNHPLVNNTGQPFVEYLTPVSELGFTAFYENTRNGVGLTDGDFVGVNGFTGTVGSYTDGLQGYQMSDADGLMRVEIDAVDLTGATNPEVNFDYFIQETGWEADDEIRIWMVVDGGVEIDILNTEGLDIDDLVIEGRWIGANVDLTGFTKATLKTSIDCNSGSEAIYLDNIRFQEQSTGGTPAMLTDVTRTLGIFISGNETNLQTSDDSYYILQTGPGFNPAEPHPCRADIGFDTGGFQANTLDVILEAHANIGGPTSVVLLKNWNTLTFDEIDRFGLSPTDTVATFPDIPANDYVSSVDRVEVRVRTFAVLILNPAVRAIISHDFAGVDMK